MLSWIVALFLMFGFWTGITILRYSWSPLRLPDFVIGDPADPYLNRWWIIPRNRWFNIYLHQFCKSDDDRALHDHPWVNMSLLLRGEYLEVIPRMKSLKYFGANVHGLLRRPFRPVFRRAKSAHRVVLFKDDKGAFVPVWSLFLTGPVIREWGFHCPHGWRHWREFVDTRDGGNKMGKGCN